MNQTAAYRQKLESNIFRYSWFKVFSKRVYLPLVTIQLVNVGGVTVEQIAVIAAISAIAVLALQVPTGYVADNWGNRRAIILGSTISAISPLFYIFAPNFYGGLAASLLFFGGFAFQSGAIEAFIHDTLIELGKEKEYSKVMGRAQSYGLIGNVVLISLIPATYSINHNLPFALGFLSLLTMLWLATTFTYPERKTSKETKSPLLAARSIVTPTNIALFVFAGFMAGVAQRGGEYRELLFQDIGIAVSVFGALLAIGSIVGAVMGRYVHILDKLSPLRFYFLDLIFMSGCLIIIGATDLPLIAIVGFTLLAGYSRVRMIVFQSKLLKDIRHQYKATLISGLNLFSTIGEIAAISILAKTIGLNGYSSGYLMFGVIVFGIGMLLWLFMLLESRNTRRPV